MTYKITLRTLDWDCYTSWESFRMRNLIEEMGVKFRRRRVSRKDYDKPSISIRTNSSEDIFYEGDLDAGSENYKCLISLLSEIWNEQNTAK